jgi:hypothetical protein
MDKKSSFGFGLFALLVALPASAHLDLLDPPARLKGEDGNTQLKTKPCGQTTNKRTDKVTTYAPGQKVDIKIKEYVNHPGYFAVAFDPDGDDSFIFPRADADKVVAASDDPQTLFPVDGTKVLGLRTDKDKDCYTENASTHECTISITIPNMPCQNCTLQVTQFMYDKLGDNKDDEYYYQCADIKIEGAAMGGSGGSGGSGGAVTAGSGGATTAGTASGGGGSGGAGASAGGGGSGGAPIVTMAGSPSAGAPIGGGGAPSGGSGTTAPTNGASADDSGCGVAHRPGGAASALSALALLFALRRRRAHSA